MSRRPEAQLEREVLRALGQHRDVVFHKNEVGEGYYGAVGGALRSLVRSRAPELLGDVERILGAHRVHYGLAVGSADLIAVVAPHGRLCAIELKSEAGALRPEQRAWLARMRELGAVASQARSVAEVECLIEEARG